MRCRFGTASGACQGTAVRTFVPSEPHIPAVCEGPALRRSRVMTNCALPSESFPVAGGAFAATEVPVDTGGRCVCGVGFVLDGYVDAFFGAADLGCSDCDTRVWVR